jgi:hypothetical protein
MKKLLLRILGIGLLLLAAAALVWDVVAPDVPGGTAAAQEGFRVGFLIGMGLRTLVLGGIGWMLLRASTRPSRTASPNERMRRILAVHVQEVPAEKPANGDLYAAASDEDVLDVYEHIDRQAQPERFSALLWAMSERVSRRSTHPGAA